MSRESIEGITSLLKLENVITLELTDVKSENIERFEGDLPASCAFWKVDKDRFYTIKEDHNCSIGRVTHGFDHPHEIYDADDFKLLKSIGWINEEDISNLPRLPTEKTIIYSSIKDSENPDLVVFFCNAEQAMMIIEAAEKANIPYKVRTKPTCAILGEAYNIKGISIGLGCTPSRLRTPYSIDDLFVAIHKSAIKRFVEVLKGIVRSNELICENKRLLV